MLLLEKRRERPFNRAVMEREIEKEAIADTLVSFFCSFYAPQGYLSSAANPKKNCSRRHLSPPSSIALSLEGEAPSVLGLLLLQEF